MKPKYQLFVTLAAFAITQDVIQTFFIAAAFWLLKATEININIKSK
jgi:hypothetical protein